MEALRKIEKFLIAIPMLFGIFYGGKDINSPKRKDYLGRIILSLAGFVMIVLILGLIFAVIW